MSESSASMSLESATLVKRMAWRMMTPRDYDNPSELDIRDNALAVRELVLIGVLDYVMIDFVESLEYRGLFKREVKKTTNRCCDVVRLLLDDIHTRILSGNDEARRRFYDLMDDGYSSLSASVLIEDDLERSYSMLCSLSRLILDINDKLRGRYDYKPIEGLRFVLRELGTLGICDKSIDFLVDKSIVTR